MVKLRSKHENINKITTPISLILKLLQNEYSIEPGEDCNTTNCFDPDFHFQPLVLDKKELNSVYMGDRETYLRILNSTVLRKDPGKRKSRKRKRYFTKYISGRKNERVPKSLQQLSDEKELLKFRLQQESQKIDKNGYIDLFENGESSQVEKNFTKTKKTESSEIISLVPSHLSRIRADKQIKEIPNNENKIRNYDYDDEDEKSIIELDSNGSVIEKEIDSEEETKKNTEWENEEEEESLIYRYTEKEKEEEETSISSSKEFKSSLRSKMSTAKSQNTSVSINQENGEKHFLDSKFSDDDILLNTANYKQSLLKCERFVKNEINEKIDFGKSKDDSDDDSSYCVSLSGDEIIQLGEVPNQYRFY